MSIKIRASWVDINTVTEGVRIYKSLSPFDENSKPEPLVEILDGATFYEDFEVIDGQTYFYMLSCFLGEREAFTECFEVKTSEEPFGWWIMNFAGYGSILNLYDSYNPTVMPLPDGYKKTVGFAHVNFDGRPTALSGFASIQKTTVINKTPVGFKFLLAGYMGFGESCENPTTIRFEHEDGSLVFALQTYKRGSMTQGLRYSFNMSSWTIVPITGGSAQLSGNLLVTASGISFENTRPSPCVNSFSVTVDLSQVKKLTVTSSARCSTSANGSAALLELKCIEEIA